MKLIAGGENTKSAVNMRELILVYTWIFKAHCVVRKHVAPKCVMSRFFTSKFLDLIKCTEYYVRCVKLDICVYQAFADIPRYTTVVSVSTVFSCTLEVASVRHL